MLDSSVIDVAIGIAVVYILVSTLCMAVREGIEAILKTRAAYLEYAIRELLNDRPGQDLAHKLFVHPLVKGLYEGDYEPGSNSKRTFWQMGGNLPSYIPARNFALALMDLVMHHPERGASPVPMTFEGLRASLDTIESPAVKRAVLSALGVAQGDLDKVRTQLEAWYDTTMDRVSGWYKRSTQWVIFAIAVLVVGLLNVNTITIVDSLYRDHTLRETTVNAAPHDLDGLTGDKALAALDSLRLPIGWSRGWGAPRTEEEWKALQKSRKETTTGRGALDDAWQNVIAPVLGLLATAFAATLGAPFWFDALNKFVELRATVKPREGVAASSHSGSEAGTAPSRTQSELTLNVASANGTTPHASHVEAELDDCDVRIERPMLDEQLPVARGGVG